ncbi:MAG: serine/threonine protein kinase, partial [Pirellulaceae bacterium]|nr:serine/threonine protein kinase [Pirellulaceae bacterium]
MGAVFRAIDTMLGRTVAVKVVGSAGADDDTLRRFRNEAQSAARLDHENIARVYYVGEDAGWNYIVFEFIEGVNIRDLVEHKGPLSLDEAVTYTLQVADALEHASRRDVVHRDIKPSNVLVTADGRAKLVDMGLARLHQVESSAEDLTASGVTLGTFDYISPEQARDPRATDVRSDLYSLGCTFYFMLTGFPPFPHGTVLQKLLSHSSEEPPDPSQYRDDLTEEVIAIINKLLAKSPRDRYQQPRDLIVDLKLLAEQLGLSSASHAGKIWIAPAQPQESFAERHLPWLVPVATLILVVLLLDRFSQSDEPLEITAPDLATRVVPVSQGSSAAAGVQPSILPAGLLDGDRGRSSPFPLPAADGGRPGATRGQVPPQAGTSREAIPPPAASGSTGAGGGSSPAGQVA